MDHHVLCTPVEDLESELEIRNSPTAVSSARFTGIRKALVSQTTFIYSRDLYAQLQCEEGCIVQCYTDSLQGHALYFFALAYSVVVLRSARSYDGRNA